MQRDGKNIKPPHPLCAPSVEKELGGELCEQVEEREDGEENGEKHDENLLFVGKKDKRRR